MIRFSHLCELLGSLLLSHKHRYILYFVNTNIEIPSEMEVAPRYKLLVTRATDPWNSLKFRWAFLGTMNFCEGSDCVLLMISAEHISTFEPRIRVYEYDSLLECFWIFRCRQCSHRCWFLHWREKKIWRRSPFCRGCRYHCACYDLLRGELCNTLCSMEGGGSKETSGFLVS